jgi:hypothetical protein
MLQQQSVKRLMSFLNVVLMQPRRQLLCIQSSERTASQAAREASAVQLATHALNAAVLVQQP